VSIRIPTSDGSPKCYFSRVVFYTLQYKQKSHHDAGEKFPRSQSAKTDSVQHRHMQHMTSI